MNNKQCGTCKAILPATNENFYSNKGGKFGLEGSCKQCANKKRKSRNSPIIYMIENTRNGMLYIGQTVKPINNRISKHFSDAKSGREQLLYEDIRNELYNRSIFKYEILESLTDISLLDVAERKWISKYKLEGFNLYNLESGGRKGNKVSDETRAKLSKSHKGKKLSDEHISKIMETKIKNGTVRRTSPLSEEAKTKISIANKGHSRSLGSKNANAILNDDIVLEIIKMLIAKTKVSEISKKYNLSKGIVSSINVRKTWSHVTVEGYERVEVYFQTRKRRNE